ncbi:MAG: hypothetical protein RR906_08020 [Acetivibrio sp.]
MISNDKPDIKKGHDRGQKFAYYLNTRIKNASINSGGIVKNIVNGGQTPKEESRLPGINHGLPGRRCKIVPYQKKEDADRDAVGKQIGNTAMKEL